MGVRAVAARWMCLLGCAASLSLDGAAFAEPPQNRLEASVAVLDLGEAAPGATVEGTVTLRNLGRRAIGIVEASTTCSCTVASIEPRVADAGGSIAVKIAFEAPKFAGEERTAELRLVTSEGETIAIPVQIRTAPALQVASIEATRLRDGAVACLIEIVALDGAPFAMVDLAADEDPDPRPAARRRVTTTIPNGPDGGLPAVVRLRTTHPLQPTVEAAIGAALLEAGIETASLRRAAVRPKPPSVADWLADESPLRVVVELPGWTDGADATRVSWTNSALEIALDSIELGPTGARATLLVESSGGGRRSLDRVTLTSPSFESTFRLTLRRGEAAR